jgi:RNA polymerase sigma factor (sigma-70 family)
VAIHGSHRELVERARAGDRDAFTAFAAMHLDRMYATASLMLHDRDLAEDAVQEALIRAWRDLPGLRDPDRAGAWLRRLLVRACYDEARRRRRGLPPAFIHSVDRAVTDEQSTTAERDVLDRAFRRLSVEHRAAIVLRHYLDLTVPDVADAMHIPLGTAKSRLHHAERALRAALAVDEREAVSHRGGA